MIDTYSQHEQNIKVEHNTVSTTTYFRFVLFVCLFVDIDGCNELLSFYCCCLLLLLLLSPKVIIDFRIVVIIPNTSAPT